MTDHILGILWFVVFLSFLPAPRYRLYEQALVIVVGTALGVLLFAGRLLKPFFDLLKIDMQSKLVSGVIVVSTLAPRVGDYVLTRGFGLSRIRRAFDNSIGGEMVGFRRDLRLKYVRGIEVSEDAPKKAELLSDIKRTRTEIRRRHTIGEILIGVTGSTLALFVGSFTILGGLAILLSVYLLVFPISMFLRSVVVDKLAYSGELVDEEEEEILYMYNWPTATLGFQQGWNRMLLTNEAIIHKIILVSYLKGEFVFGYELGEELIEKVLTGEMDLEEAFDELVYDHLGEDAPEAHIFRRVVKRFLGI